MPKQMNEIQDMFYEKELCFFMGKSPGALFISLSLYMIARLRPCFCQFNHFSRSCNFKYYFCTYLTRAPRPCFFKKVFLVHVCLIVWLWFYVIRQTFLSFKTRTFDKSNRPCFVQLPRAESSFNVLAHRSKNLQIHVSIYLPPFTLYGEIL